MMNENPTSPDASETRYDVVASLMVAAEHIRQDAVRQLAAAGRTGLSILRADYVQQLAACEHTPGSLAEQVGVSKQFCSKVIAELIEAGLVRRGPHPEDSRSALLSLTANGWQLVRDGRRAADTSCAGLERRIGRDLLGSFIEIVDVLCRRLSLHPADGGRSAGRLSLTLPLLAQEVRQRLQDALLAQRFTRVSTSGFHILELTSHGPVQMRTLATRIGISKQAVAAAAIEMEQIGYVHRTADPDDRRQRILQLSPLGRHLVASGARAARETEALLERLLGPSQYRLFEEALHAIRRSIDAPTDTIGTLSKRLVAELGTDGARLLAGELLRTANAVGQSERRPIRPDALPAAPLSLN